VESCSAQIHERGSSSHSSDVALLRCLLVAPRAVVSIMAKLTALETAIGLDWCVVASGLRVHGTTLTSL
jgi:sensor domain CHASE-containing protein